MIIITKLYNCLLEWIMVAPRQVVGNPNTAQMICDVLEDGLLAESENRTQHSVVTEMREQVSNIIQNTAKHETPDDSPGKKTSLFDLSANRRSMSRLKTAPSIVALESDSEDILTVKSPGSTDTLKLLGFGQLISQPVSTAVDEFEVNNVDSSLINETAENVLGITSLCLTSDHIMHHLNNYPPPHGPELISSTINDPAYVDETAKAFDKYLYFTYNDTTIIAIIEIPGSTPQGMLPNI